MANPAAMRPPLWSLLPDELALDVCGRLHVRDRAALMCCSRSVASQLAPFPWASDAPLKALWLLQKKRLAAAEPEQKRELSRAVWDLLSRHPTDPTVAEFVAAVAEAGEAGDAGDAGAAPGPASVAATCAEVLHRVRSCDGGAQLDLSGVDLSALASPSAATRAFGSGLRDAAMKHAGAREMQQLEACPILGPILAEAMYGRPFEGHPLSTALIFRNAEMVAHLFSSPAHAAGVERFLAMNVPSAGIWRYEPTVTTLLACARAVRLPRSLLRGIADAALEELDFRAYRAYAGWPPE